MEDIIIPEKKARTFLPENFKVSDWEAVKPYFDDLLQRNIQSAAELRRWFKDRSELEAVLSENLAWRYIKMTCDTTNEKIRESYNEFITQIQPRIEPVSNELNQKALQSPFLEELKQEGGYPIMIRELEKEAKIYREANIALKTEEQQEAQNFGAISGNMSVEIGGQEMTLQQAANLLQSVDRVEREDAYRKITSRRLQDKDKLDALFSKLVSIRDSIGKNAGFENYRDYMFAAMGRFDYSKEDCFNFHEAVAKEVVPMLNDLAKERKASLALDRLRPWDKSVDTSGKPPLKPFTSGNELTVKTIECFSKLDPYLGERIAIMQAMGHLDLESRKGKAPGGYNYPLAEIGVPFIFMNATSNLRDMVTIMHEGGHAVHSFLTRDLELNNFKHTPSEVAELASMSMELISMDHWDLFFTDEDNLKRAKRQHLEQIIETLPWVATIDKFQHWVYEHPGHTLEERKKAWNEIFGTFSDSITDWAELEDERSYLWQKQLHLFEVPFYYIEYGFAQLGAVAVWKNYKANPKKGLDGYKNALKIGYTRTIPEVYEAAGIKFDFSTEYIRSLMYFVKDELSKI
ncbi:M3 family oligoendopeptidase [Catalinimonas niigatensis]|uniref:M3 family oligoendopeptidase n=1 Tax=Catalinimonas niigatensis TaxID=1397264 RepID=UPI0026652D1F|nr:M3 family oligoendopeptidase [Catalinimonas niigatensis]WPP49444.1 M3 family oligoendopeptidase [Catalinimonas niigatensis]